MSIDVPNLLWAVLNCSRFCTLATYTSILFRPRCPFAVLIESPGNVDVVAEFNTDEATKTNLLKRIYDAPFIIPASIGIYRLDIPRGVCIIRTDEKLSDNEVLSFANEKGGRWMMWNVEQENPRQLPNGNYEYILKIVR